MVNEEFGSWNMLVVNEQFGLCLSHFLGLEHVGGK